MSILYPTLLLCFPNEQQILASSTALISTPSIGMEEMLGNFISVVDNEDDARLTLTNLLKDDNYRNKFSWLS